MGFINNHKDNFLPSNHPWDDSTQKYTLPNKKKKSLSMLDYDVLQNMLEEMSMSYKAMPMCRDKVRLKEKMMAVIQEIKKRDELELATQQERGNNFEPPVEPSAVVHQEEPILTSQPTSQPVSPTVSISSSDDWSDLHLDELDLEDCDIDDDLDDDIDDDLDVDTSSQDTNNMLIAGLIVICVLSFINNK